MDKLVIWEYLSKSRFQEVLLNSSAVAVLDKTKFYIKFFINVLADLRISLGLLKYFNFVSTVYNSDMLDLAYFVSFCKFY